MNGCLEFSIRLLCPLLGNAPEKVVTQLGHNPLVWGIAENGVAFARASLAIGEQTENVGKRSLILPFRWPTCSCSQPRHWPALVGPNR